MSEEDRNLPDLIGSARHPDLPAVVWGCVAALVAIFLLIGIVIAATVPQSQDASDVLKMIGLGVITLIVLAIIVAVSSIGMHGRKEAP